MALRTSKRRNSRTRDLVVVGASAGGVEALIRLVATLPADLPAAVAVVLHVAPGSASSIARILDRSGPLPATAAEDGAPLAPNRIVVAPPDRHLVVADGNARLVDGPRENGVRPGIDPLFRSAARERGPWVVGVVLSGTLDDGSAGLFAIRRVGGCAIVQSPDDALFPDMPLHALDLAGADHCVPVDEMGPILRRLVEARVEGAMASKKERITPAEGGTPGRPPGDPSAFSCPECGGVLWAADGMGRFECRTGHAFSPRSLGADQADKVEEALWGAIRAVEELAAMARRLEGRARERGANGTAERFASQAVEQEARVETLRTLVGAPRHAMPALGSGRRIAARRPPPRRRAAR
ncbi:MAG: chemotaxis protein CheB [Anaeromyxobacteraceae bacterium]